MLPNGVVLSCAYDKKVIAWNYINAEILEQYERNEELRCMDFIDIANQKKLYVGTNRGVILTIDISNLLAMELEDEYGLHGMDMEMDMDMDYMEEQIISSKNRKKGK